MANTNVYMLYPLWSAITVSLLQMHITLIRLFDEGRTFEPCIYWFMIAWNNQNNISILVITIFSAPNWSSILICHTLILPHKNKWLVLYSQLCMTPSVLKLKQKKRGVTHTCHAKQWPTPPSWYIPGQSMHFRGAQLPARLLGSLNFGHTMCWPLYFKSKKKTLF